MNGTLDGSYLETDEITETIRLLRRWMKAYVLGRDSVTDYHVYYNPYERGTADWRQYERGHRDAMEAQR